MEYNFDVKKVTEDCIKFIQDFFENNGKDCNCVLGISAGKDSSIVAALCVEALGKDRVIGVMMPDGEQKDIDVAYSLVRHLGIRAYEINIENPVYNILKNVQHCMPLSEQTVINLPARIRMATLYAVSQSCNGRVVNTSNLSEDWIGWNSRWGDAVGDFSPLSRLTSDEVIAIGEYLGLPTKFTRKTPSDGLCGMTDEEKFGFTYEVLNKYIRTGVCEDEEIKKKIDDMHEKNLFKLMTMPCFLPEDLKVKVYE